MATSTGTAALTPMPVGDLRGNFFVPAYQRGYRWGAVEVQRLLDDVAAAGNSPYYLQPIVVKARGDDSWELVDGQQRLTTLYLVLRYIRQEILHSATAKYALEYETRAGSADYLDRLDEESSQSNIDYFHMHQAYRTITDWFEQKPDKVQVGVNFYLALAERVMVIWYEAPPEVDATTLFTRLNVGRIPLTDAELVKALLLSQIRATNPDRAYQVAAQWDGIERDLRAPEAWAFISGREGSEANHIGLLLDALAGTPPGRSTPLYTTFEALRPRIETEPQRFWDDVVDLHSRVTGWYDDRQAYHRIGYLVASGTTLQDLRRMSEGRTKSAFRAALVQAIRDGLRLTESALRELTYRHPRTGDVLLLMNVETMLANRFSTERYSFRAHASGDWSLEHVHAQQSERLVTAPQWRTWLELHLAALETLSGVAPSTLARLRSQVPAEDRRLTQRVFDDLEQQVRRAFAAAGQDSDGDIDAIDNLALLDGRSNSALNNSVFEVKRRQIIERDKAGQYIPVCTRNVFLKYYTDSPGQQTHFWGRVDRECYMAALVDVLRPYLRDEDDDD